VLVNNAGIIRDCVFRRMTSEESGFATGSDFSLNGGPHMS
jgi:hypothetical protein